MTATPPLPAQPDPAGDTTRPGSRSVERLRVTRAEGGQIHLAGEIDQTGAGILREVLQSLPAGTSSLVLDLCEVDYLESAGLAVLFEQAAGGLSVRVRPGTAVAKVIGVCGLSELVAVEFVPAAQP